MMEQVLAISSSQRVKKESIMSVPPTHSRRITFSHNKNRPAYSSYLCRQFGFALAIIGGLGGLGVAADRLRGSLEASSLSLQPIVMAIFDLVGGVICIRGGIRGLKSLSTLKKIEVYEDSQHLPEDNGAGVGSF